MSTADPNAADRASPRWLGLEHQRRLHMESPEFDRTLRALLEGLDVEIFEEEWQRVTIVNRAKELALAVGIDGLDPWIARRDLEQFYARKRRFFLADDDEQGS